MTTQTRDVLLRRLGACFRPKIGQPRQRSSARLYMRASWSMARLALQTTMSEWAVWVIGSGVLGAENSGNAAIVMTAEAGISSIRTVDGIGMRRAIGGRPVGGDCMCDEAQQQSDYGAREARRSQLSSPWWGCRARPSHPQLRRGRDRYCMSPRSQDWCLQSCGPPRPS
jgi:hypothetical protein